MLRNEGGRLVTVSETKVTEASDALGRSKRGKG